MSDEILKDGGGILNFSAVGVCQALVNSGGIQAVPYGGTETITGDFAIMAYLISEDVYLTLEFRTGFMSLDSNATTDPHVRTITSALNAAGMPAVPVTEGTTADLTDTAVLTADSTGEVPRTMTVSVGWLL